MPCRLTVGPFILAVVLTSVSCGGNCSTPVAPAVTASIGSAPYPAGHPTADNSRCIKDAALTVGDTAFPGFYVPSGCAARLPAGATVLADSDLVAGNTRVGRNGANAILVGELPAAMEVIAGKTGFWWHEARDAKQWCDLIAATRNNGHLCQTFFTPWATPTPSPR